MKSRLIASAAVCAAAILGMTGCMAGAPQATELTIQYSPLGGINVPDTGAPLLVRSAAIVATSDGDTGNLIAAVINTTGAPHTLNVQIQAGASRITETLRVPAHATRSLGENTHPLRIEDLNVMPGATVPVYFQSGAAEGAKVDMPVLGGNDAYLQKFVPKPLTTPSPTATPAPTVTP